MATIALPRPIAPHRSTSNSLGSLTSTITLDSINPQQPSCTPAPVPNKHIPVCPPGPAPQDEPNTPPPSPGKEEDPLQQSLLFPPDQYNRLETGSLSLYKIEAADVAAALEYAARQPLPEPSQVFPWFHGLHPSNSLQQGYFIARKRALRRTPCCLRGITIVKADGNLDTGRLKGAIAPHEFLQLGGAGAEFLDIDPREGFSVRNFQIQAAKAAMTSDIIVYGDDEVAIRKLGWDIVAAQERWREKHEVQRHKLPTYNTFICVSPFSQFEEECPDLVAVDSLGRLTGNVLDFVYQERKEMYAMTRSSEIAHNVWLGPTPDPSMGEDCNYDVLIECSDLGRLNPAALKAIAEDEDQDDVHSKQYQVDFPSSGSILAPTWSHAEADGILDTCKWIYHLAHGTHPNYPQTTTSNHSNDRDGDTPMLDTDAHSDTAPNSHPPHLRPRKILIYCGDGYTESTVLAIAYYSYSTGLPVPAAWLDLHTSKKRNFFAYPSDVALLSAIAARLIYESPTRQGKSLAEVTELVKNEPRWFVHGQGGFDGSFPSRILDYMYLGNLGHANNPDLLRELGIGQILSVGETASWREGEMERWGADNVCVVAGVQDNGIDPLTEEFERCLEFIDRGRRRGTATLVHCRVGVSRSATICIAEVMRTFNLSFPRAYCFVRARRLNVIIQPHLRFAYELLKWEELIPGRNSDNPTRDISSSPPPQSTPEESDEVEAKAKTQAEADVRSSRSTRSSSSASVRMSRREFEWSEIAREVAAMNKPYAR